ncbi:MAG: hypothetical protein B7Z72_01780 [Gemmatimonadetes bacterium 21-71-4]|nr:MAG: hypothetical protein B7Z72_01780 [Gemmatimonadetes bacterium 21-71-4]
MFRPRHAVLLLVAVIAAWVALQRISKVPEQPAPPAQVRREVLAVFEHGARAWNAGNLDDFMSDYLPDSETTFITKTGVLHGVAAIRNVYAARFSPGARRDSLRFQGVEIDILAPDVVNAIAWYVLMRGDSITARGPTSLVMRRVSGRWRIVHDHSS